MTVFVSGFALAASLVLLVLGVVDVVRAWGATEKVRQAADATADAAGKIAGGATEGGTELQSSFDAAGQLEALAALAVALKDLDRGTRLIVLSLAFLLVAGVTAGLASIADGLG